MMLSFDVDGPVHAMQVEQTEHARTAQASSILDHSWQLALPVPAGIRAVDSWHCAMMIVSSVRQLADVPIHA